MVVVVVVVVVVVAVVVVIIVVTRAETRQMHFLTGKTHLHVVLLPFLRSFSELALDHGFRQE